LEKKNDIFLSECKGLQVIDEKGNSNAQRFVKIQ